MKARLPFFLGILILVLGVVAGSALFTVDQREQAIVFQFGNPKRVISEPGLHAKLPFIQDVRYYERRVLNLDPPVERVVLADQKPRLVDTYARYRITDPLRFFQTVRSEGDLRNRLGSIVNANLRNVLGNVNLASVLSEERADIMRAIRQTVNAQGQRFGIEIVDVRIRRADLPNETSQAVYERMKTEREREAAEFRAQGFELAQRIRAGADREATVIKAEAEREAEILRGQGDAQRTQILNEAYGQDADFFSFYRSMQAYAASLTQGSYMVLSPDSDFFRFFDDVEQSGRGINTPTQ